MPGPSFSNRQFDPFARIRNAPTLSRGVVALLNQTSPRSLSHR